MNAPIFDDDDAFPTYTTLPAGYTITDPGLGNLDTQPGPAWADLIDYMPYDPTAVDHDYRYNVILDGFILDAYSILGIPCVYMADDQRDTDDHPLWLVDCDVLRDWLVQTLSPIGYALLALIFTMQRPPYTTM